LVQKFFPLDKNYLLEEVQLALRDELLVAMVEEVKRAFETEANSLGLEDKFAAKIRRYQITPRKLKPLFNFYLHLSAAYRFKFSSNQLEFIWDGRDQLERYHEEWPQAFRKLIGEFCKQELFVQAVLDLTVFHSENPNSELSGNRMNNFMLRQFGVKLHKTKGLVAMKVA
jgi:hypothetical protein